MTTTMRTADEIREALRKLEGLNSISRLRARGIRTRGGPYAKSVLRTIDLTLREREAQAEILRWVLGEGLRYADLTEAGDE
jgi:hypothetical protein